MPAGRLGVLEQRVGILEGKVQANTPTSGNGINVTDVVNGGGKSMNLAPKGQQQAAIDLGQLQIYVQDQATSTLGITAGQVANQVEDGTDTWAVSGDGTIWAQVDVSTSFAFSNLSIFDNGASGPPPIDGTHAFQLIGNYKTVAGKLQAQPMVGGSQGLSVCFSDPTALLVIPTWVLV